MNAKAPEADVTADGQSAAHQLADLRDQLGRRDGELAEKDDIIGSLTEKLEQVAEQLDRAKRSGADRGPRGVPPEVAEQQERAAATLGEIAGHFEGVDLGGSLSRLEMLVSEVRDVVLSERRPAETADAFEAAETTPKPDLLGGWASIRDQFMGGEGDASEVAADGGTPGSSADSAFDGDRTDSEADEAAPVGVVGPVAIALPEEPPAVDALPDDLPEPVDFDAADRDELVAAVEVRDRYIGLLTRRVADRRAKLTVPTDWSLLAGDSDGLAEATRRLHEELDDAVRTAEVDLCLERARLSRERTRLEAMQPAAESDDKQAAAKSSRWSRVLGVRD